MKNLDIEIPQPKVLYDPLIIALAWATDFTAGRFVPCDSIFAQTLKLAGYNHHEIPREILQPPHGVSKPHQNYFWCKFLLAFRYQKEKPVKGEAEIRCSPDPHRRGYWGLTTYGIDQAMGMELTKYQENDCERLFKYLNFTKSGQSLTHMWIEKEWPKLQKRVLYILNNSNTLKVSQNSCLVSEHVSNFFEVALEKDLLANFIKEGRNITVSKLVRWISQRAYLQMRNWGKDASCFVHRGVLTSTVMKDTDLAEYHRTYPLWKRRIEVGITDCGDYHTTQGVNHHLGISQALDTLMASLTGIGRTPDEVVRRVVQAYYFEDNTLNECAEILELTPNQVKKVVTGIRQKAKAKFGSSSKLLDFGKTKNLSWQVSVEKSVAEVGL